MAARGSVRSNRATAEGVGKAQLGVHVSLSQESPAVARWTHSLGVSHHISSAWLGCHGAGVDRTGRQNSVTGPCLYVAWEWLQQTHSTGEPL